MKTNNPLYQTNPELFGLTDTHLTRESQWLSLSIEAMKAFKELQSLAKDEGIDLQPVSSFRSFKEQKAIWNAKVLGNKPVLNDECVEVDRSSCSQKEWIYSILRWSAFPGLSRHHWGTELDVYDKSYFIKNPEYKIQLIPNEYELNGPFEKLGQFLDKHLENTDFFRPYSKDQGGVAVEPWHISYRPLSEGNLDLLNEGEFITFLDSKHCQDIELVEVVKENANDIFQRFCTSISS